jgi:uncharacterized YccA/Bax inhibitor family protein
MAIFKFGNPAMNVFENTISISGEGVMTERGTLDKFFMLFLLVMASASLTWKAFYDGVNVMPYMLGAALLGFITAMVVISKMQWAAYLAPLYALFQGVFLGGISATYNNVFAKTAPGIVTQAVLLTFGVAISMFFLYRFRIIKVTEKLRSIILTAIIGIFIFYVLDFVVRLFGIHIASIHEGTPLGIAFSLFVVVVASLTLLLNFDNIEKGVTAGAPKFMEWYGAFGLMVTIIWLYINILQLLAKLANRR